MTLAQALALDCVESQHLKAQLLIVSVTLTLGNLIAQRDENDFVVQRSVQSEFETLRQVIDRRAKARYFILSRDPDTMPYSKS